MSSPEDKQISLRVDPEFYKVIRIAAILGEMSIPQYVTQAAKEKLTSEAEQDLEKLSEVVDGVRSSSSSVPDKDLAD